MRANIFTYSKNEIIKKCQKCPALVLGNLGLGLLFTHFKIAIKRAILKDREEWEPIKYFKNGSPPVSSNLELQATQLVFCGGTLQYRNLKCQTL